MSCDCSKPNGYHEHYCGGELTDDWLKDQRTGEYNVTLKGFDKAPHCSVGGVSSKEASDNIAEAMKMSDVEELSLLFQAATQKMKDDHARMMKKAKRDVMWLSLLVACAIAYELWAVPALKKWMWP